MQPHRKRQWCISAITSEFLARLEIIIRIYLLPYNELRPVVCFDERPCFLIGDTVMGLDMKQGSPAKENYAYTKHGSCCVLATIEPITAKRLAHIRRHRGKKEFTLFMKNLATIYPKAEKIVLILDNLNTHNFSGFYENLSAEEAAELAQRFEFICTSKCASWMNRAAFRMIEIEFSALSRQCLNRRIPSINQLSKEVLTYFKERSDLKIKINWQFSCQMAREKLNSHYAKVNSENIKYQKTY